MVHPYRQWPISLMWMEDHLGGNSMALNRFASSTTVLASSTSTGLWVCYPKSHESPRGTVDKAAFKTLEISSQLTRLQPGCLKASSIGQSVIHSCIQRICLSVPGKGHKLGCWSTKHVSSLQTSSGDRPSTRSASVYAGVFCILLLSVVCISCDEKVTVLVMLLVRSFHCLLLQSVTPCGLAVVMRCKVGLRELGGLGPGGPNSSMMGVRQGVRAI